MTGEEVLRLREAWAASPESLAFVPLAEALRRRGDLDEAIEVSRSGLESRPNHSSAHLVLGRCHFDKGDLSEAIREFEEVVSLDPKNGLALRLLGLALKGKGWGREESSGGPAQVADAAAAASRVRVAPGDDLGDIEFFTRTMAEILERQGFHRKALEIYRRLATSYPDRPDFHEGIIRLEQLLSGNPGDGGRLS